MLFNREDNKAPGVAQKGSKVTRSKSSRNVSALLPCEAGQTAMSFCIRRVSRSSSQRWREAPEVGIAVEGDGEDGEEEEEEEEEEEDEEAGAAAKTERCWASMERKAGMESWRSGGKWRPVEEVDRCT